MGLSNLLGQLQDPLWKFYDRLQLLRWFQLQNLKTKSIYGTSAVCHRVTVVCRGRRKDTLYLTVNCTRRIQVLNHYSRGLPNFRSCLKQQWFRSDSSHIYIEERGCDRLKTHDFDACNFDAATRTTHQIKGTGLAKVDSMQFKIFMPLAYKGQHCNELQHAGCLLSGEMKNVPIFTSSLRWRVRQFNKFW